MAGVLTVNASTSDEAIIFDGRGSQPVRPRPLDMDYASHMIGWMCARDSGLHVMDGPRFRSVMCHQHQRRVARANMRSLGLSDRVHSREVGALVLRRHPLLGLLRAVCGGGDSDLEGEGLAMAVLRDRPRAD
jgi:hypothetical protein